MSTHRHSLLLLFSLAAIVCESSAAVAQQHVEDADAAQCPLAGAPIAEARRRAISDAPFHRTLDADTIRKWMQLSSRCTIAEFELFLAPLSPLEETLLRKIEQTPAPIVNRLHFGHLRGVLKNAGIIALELEEESRRTNVPHVTPALENDLFGAFDCVFASVGPLHGSPRYGDVIIRLKDSVRENGWATPFSGMHFLAAIRGKPVDEMQNLLASGHTLPTASTNPLSLGFDDRLHYSHYIVTEEHWNKALAYQAILVLRNLDDSETGDRVRQRLESMLAENEAGKFWTLFIPPRETGLSPVKQQERVPFGYLEAKFPGRVSIEHFSSIEVPPDRLAEVRAWPEAKPYLHLIRSKPNGVE